jgi:2-phospho-L-lactate guanylyltransferase
MLDGVLIAATQASLDSVWVVTRDAEVIALARAFKAEVLEEPVNQGHTAAVSLAQAELAGQGVEGFLTIPGDVPLVTSDEITALIHSSSAPPSVTLVPSRQGFGTNGVFLAPPNLLRLRFGEPSFENHVKAAQGNGLEPMILTLPGLGLDLDTPEDLQAFLTVPNGTRTARFLEGVGITRRMAEPSTAPRR